MIYHWASACEYVRNWAIRSGAKDERQNRRALSLSLSAAKRTSQIVEIHNRTLEAAGRMKVPSRTRSFVNKHPRDGRNQLSLTCRVTLHMRLLTSADRFLRCVRHVCLGSVRFMCIDEALGLAGPHDGDLSGDPGVAGKC